MSRRSDTDVATLAATLGAAFMIAYQISGKATRQTLVLSFPMASVPVVIGGAALFSILLVPVFSTAMSAVGPSRLVPYGFASSGLLHLVEWALFPHFPKPVAALFYLHYSGLGAVLISGFWSLVSERFDPHTARLRISRITTGAAVGALAGGGIAWAAGAARTMLPVLSAMHLACAAVFASMPAPVGMPRPATDGTPSGFRAGVRLIRTHSYLRDLALLVFVGAGGAILIEVVFLTRARSVIAHDDRLGFFALVYTAASVANFIVNAAVARPLLDRAGLDITAGTHPASILMGSLGAALAPGGVVSAVIARGSEQVIHNSLFRSAYELFYTPLPPAEKRSAKPMIDVGAERLGDMAGAAVSRGLLTSQPLLLGAAAGAGLAGLWIVRRLNRGYVAALERSLRERTVGLTSEDVTDHTTRLTLARVMGAPEPGRPPRGGQTEDSPTVVQDRLPLRIAELRTGDPDRVRRALADGALTPAVAPHAIALLGWDDVAQDAMRALRNAGPGITSQLVDALLDGAVEFTIRRRVPRVLAAFPSARAVDALVLGLSDKRFEVRYRCGRSLLAMLDADNGLTLPPADVYRVVSRELEVDKHLWESHRLLDGGPEDQVVGDRVNRALEHVFTLLSLILPRKPLQISLYALHTDDAMLRGTALEYLDSLLPLPIRERLGFLLGDARAEARPPRGSADSLAALLKSHESIQARLLELKAKQAASAKITPANSQE